VLWRRAEAGERGARRRSGATSPRCEGSIEDKATQARGRGEVEHGTLRWGQATGWRGRGQNWWGQGDVGAVGIMPGARTLGLLY
jgi:hypothetical protein